MLALSRHPALKYILFGNIYFANGISAALGVTLLIVYFIDKDITIATATIVAGVASIPFTFKFLFGPLIDRFIKRGRKPFIITGALLGGITFIPLAFIDPAVSLFPFALVLFIGVIGIVLLDVAADTWAIQVTKYHERGKINAAMFGSLFGGMAIGNVMFSFIAQNFGYKMSFILGGSIILLTVIITSIVKEEIFVKKRPKMGKLLISEFKKKNTIIISIFAFVSAMNFGILLFIIPEYMMNFLNLEIAQIGLITSLFPIGVVLGSTTGGVMTDRWGRKKTLAIFLFGAIIFSSLLITVNSWQMLAIIYPIIGFLQGGSSFSALMALFMDITNPKIGGTQYSILTSITNFGDYSIAIVSGSLLMVLGYQKFFLYAAWIVGPALLILYFVKEAKK